jgi:hypothetical protein
VYESSKVKFFFPSLLNVLMFELSNLSTFVKCGSTLHWWLLKEEGHVPLVVVSKALFLSTWLVYLYMLEKAQNLFR